MHEERWGKEQWFWIISEYTESGLTQKEFAARHQVSHNAVQFRLHKLATRCGSTVTLLPVSGHVSCAL